MPSTSTGIVCTWCGHQVPGHQPGCPRDPTSAKKLPITETPTARGWLCPACGAGNAPWSPRCSCKGAPRMEVTC